MKNMKKLFSKTVAAMLSITCMGSIMTTSFNGTPLFTPKLIAEASSGVSFDEETGVLTLYGNIENMFALANYSGDKRVKEVKALKGTVLPADCNKLFSRFEAEKIDISNADTSHVTNMSDMFSCCSNLKYLNLDNIDTSNVTNMYQTFYACPNLKSINLQSFNTSNVTDMMNMFFHCSSLETLDLSGFDTSSVTTMVCMFQECTNLESVDFSSFNTRNLENMNGMFQNCTNLKSLDFSNFDTSSLKHFTRVFPYCENLEEIIFGNFNTSNVTEMDYLFYGCISLKKLDLSSFDISNVENTSYMFGNCKNLKRIFVSDKWSNNKVKNSLNMFWGCDSLEGGNKTTYSQDIIDHRRACIDTTETPGYFTQKTILSIPGFIFENIASEILDPLPDIKSGDDIDNNPVPDNSSNPTNNDSNDNSNQNNSTSSDNNNVQSNTTINIDDTVKTYMNIKDLINFYGCDHEYNGSIICMLKGNKFFLGAFDNIYNTGYYDITSYDNIALEVYKKAGDDYQRIEETVGYANTYYLEKNNTYVIKGYETKTEEYRLGLITIYISLHVDRINENQEAMFWKPREISNKSNSIFGKDITAIIYIPTDKVSDFYDDAFCDKDLKNQSEWYQKLFAIIFAGLGEYSENGLQAMLSKYLELETDDLVNVWEYITENVQIESNRFKNGIKITKKGQDVPIKTVDDISIEKWDGEVMQGNEGYIGYFIPFDYSDLSQSPGSGGGAW